MTATLVVPQRVRVAGDLFHGRVPAGAVYVGRPAPGLPGSRFANPHKVGACRVCRVRHDQAGAVAAYAEDLDGDLVLLAAVREELAGRDLACWCRPGLPCHATVLVVRANATVPAGSLADPVEWEGTCPCCPEVLGVDESARMRWHRIPPCHGRPVCPGTGQPAREVHPREHWRVEGVTYL
jgi:hypothetical protein